MNCCVKYLAIAEGLVQVLTAPSRFENLIGWFGGMRVHLPDNDLIRDQNLWVPALKAGEEIVCLHLTLAASFKRCPISVLRAGMSGSDGSAALFESRSAVSLTTSGVREGSKSFLKPAGIEVFAALSSILYKIFTAWLAEVGGGKVRKCCSVRVVKLVQFARWKFV